MQSHICLHNKNAQLFFPNSQCPEEAFTGITHLGIGAHQDDLEFHALHGILECFETGSFAGITCTNGSGCARTDSYKDVSDQEMAIIRQQEQNLAATIGRYRLMAQLDYSSNTIRDVNNTNLRDDLKVLLEAIRPTAVYTHNLADKHLTHVAVALRVIESLRLLPKDIRPKKLYGFEAWRNLDWLPDDEKVLLDVSSRTNLSAALAGVFDSQIGGGKRYHLAIEGRRLANATMIDAYTPDKQTHLSYATDLTPLIIDDTLDPLEHTLQSIRRFEDEVRNSFRKCLEQKSP